MPPLLKQAFSFALAGTGTVRRHLEERSRAGEYLILMYHRILPARFTPPGLQAGMYVRTETFRSHLRYLKRRFRIIPFRELAESGVAEKGAPCGLPCCILTFDDGWSDFYGQAYPVLREEKVSATVFLPTRYIGTEERFWTDEIARILVEKERVACPTTKDAAQCPEPAASLLSMRGPREERIENAIRLLKGYRYGDVARTLERLREVWGIEGAEGERAFLKWEEVKEMAASGTVSFGSHTAGHSILTLLEDAEIRAELAESRERLLSEGVADASCMTFSYPNGNHDGRVARIVAETGYRFAVTTEKGWNGPSASPFLLRRISIHQDMASGDALFGSRIAGLL